MAQFEIETEVSGPGKIEVPLVRADTLEFSNIFRMCFEAFLSITSAVGGSAMSSENVSTIHAIFIAVSALATIAFLVLTWIYRGRAEKSGSKPVEKADTA
jgi:hypothetical protein